MGSVGFPSPGLDVPRSPTLPWQGATWLDHGWLAMPPFLLLLLPVLILLLPPAAAIAPSGRLGARLRLLVCGGISPKGDSKRSSTYKIMKRLRKTPGCASEEPSRVTQGTAEAAANRRVSYPVLGKPRGHRRIQFIAYEICTMPHGYETKGRSDDDWYIGIEDIPTDMAGRVRLLGRALERALAHEAVDPDPGTLKVFMAPEFLFRGPRGAYMLGDILGAHDSTDGLQGQLASLVLDERWADWAFSFGTCVGYKSVPCEKRCHYEVYNVALVQHGGSGTLEAAEKDRTALIKMNKSSIDFLADPQFGGLSSGNVHYVLKPIRELDAGGDRDVLEIDDDGIFVLNGITLGLEICLDHALGKLKGTEPMPGENQIQVQLVPSGGMSVKSKSVCVGKGGLVFHCDGLLDCGNHYGAHSSAFRYPAGAPRERLQPLASIDAHGENWKEVLEGLYHTGVASGPKISIYPAQDVPPAIPNPARKGEKCEEGDRADRGRDPRQQRRPQQ